MRRPFDNKIQIGLRNAVLAFLLVGGVLISLGAAQSAWADTVGDADIKPPTNGVSNTTSYGNLIGYVLLTPAAGITWLGGKALEVSVEKLVLGMKNIYDGGLGYTVETVWKIVRDLCNLAFIFGFIYLGIRTIFDSESANVKRMLASIIIGALLINFSLFFAKFIIDVGNVFAVNIMTTLSIDGSSLTYQIADTLGLTTIYNPKQSGAILGNLTAGANITFFVMAAIFLLVAAFVMFAGAFLLMIRFVALVFIMIFSPVLFGATVFPQTQRYASMLWSKLISYSFFAPAYLFLLYVSLAVLNGIMTSFGKGKLADALQGTAGSAPTSGMFDVVLLFVICILFLIYSLKIAQQLSVFGADRAISLTKQWSGRATAGLAAAAGRATIGKYAHSMSEDERLKDRASQKGVRGFVARQQLKASRVVGDSSFDARNTAAGKALGFEGRKGGYTTMKKEVEERETKFARSLGEIKDDDVEVQARKKEFSFEQSRLRTLEEELNRIDKNDVGARVAKRDEIEKQKELIQNSQVAFEREKQRRIVGSTYSKPNPGDAALIKKQKDDIKTLMNDIKTEWDVYVRLPDVAKEGHRSVIQTLKTQLDNLQSKHAELLKNQPDRGYAGVLESSKRITAWPKGRMVTHEREAGRAIRKTAEKGLPKEK